MTDETSLSRMHPSDLEELKDAMRSGSAGREKLPYVATGSDAVMFREVASTLFDEKLRERGLDDRAIKATAKEVARQVVTEDIKAIEQRISKFLTIDEIKKTVLEALSDVGLRADSEHAYETRRTVEQLFDGQKRKSAVTKDVLTETIKTVIGYVIAGALALLGFSAFKGGGH